MSAPTEPLSPTTGEPVSVVARRNRLGIWLCIVSDASGTLALLIAYSYLWSLNVNSAWAPPNGAWAEPLLFWLIALLVIVSAIVMWWGVVGIEQGHSGRLITAALVATVIALAGLVVQLFQLATFPFDPTDGAYASATFWLALATAIHLFLVIFLATAVLNRTRRGLISPENPFQARLVAMWMTWICIAVVLGALFATTMTDSPNADSPDFGTFRNSSSSTG